MFSFQLCKTGTERQLSAPCDSSLQPAVVLTPAQRPLANSQSGTEHNCVSNISLTWHKSRAVVHWWGAELHKHKYLYSQHIPEKQTKHLLERAKIFPVLFDFSLSSGKSQTKGHDLSFYLIILLLFPKLFPSDHTESGECHVDILHNCHFITVVRFKHIDSTGNTVWYKRDSCMGACIQHSGDSTTHWMLQIINCIIPHTDTIWHHMDIILVGCRLNTA